MGNFGLSLEVIRTGLGQVGAALDRMAPTPGAASLEPNHRSRGSTTDDGNGSREGAPETDRDDLERMVSLSQPLVTHQLNCVTDWPTT